MKTFTVNAYEYNELSQDAKNKVREWLCKDNDTSYLFNEMLEESINETFPNSQLKYQYSLNHCPGDGLYVYGALSTIDIIAYIVDNQQKLELTDKQVKRMKFYCNVLDNWGVLLIMPHNPYGYCYFNESNVFYSVFDAFSIELEKASFENIYYVNIRRLSSIIAEYIDIFCTDWEKRGYNYFEWAFNASDEEISELCDCNDWLFDESGYLL